MNGKYRIFYFFLPLLLMLLLNALAEQYHLYFYFWWLDMPVHFFAGYFVAQLVIVLVAQLKKWDTTALLTREMIALSVLVALFVGLIWEMYEFFFNSHIIPSSHYLLDTVLDVGMDAVGGLFGAYVLRKSRYNGRHE